jgi:hypothetical protein
MTDDTLREECEAAGVIAHYYCIDAYYSCPLSEDDCHDEAPGNVRHLSSDQCTCGYEEKMLALMTFARAQQAKGLREAAEILHADNNPYVGNCVVKLEAQATAREGAARDKPVGMLSAQELNERWEKWQS